MAVIIGSARIDERGKLSGGQAGDQKQTSKPDYKGEVSMQEFYVHSKGWYVLRPKKVEDAVRIARNMEIACNNKCLGYDQYNRLGVIYYGLNTDSNTECDCSSLVRECVNEACKKDPGNFNTESEAGILEASGLFYKREKYVAGMELYTGDVLVTCTKGHTVIVVQGASRTPVNYYPKYTGKTDSIVQALKAVGVDSSMDNRKKIAKKNGISGYKGTAAQNLTMLGLLKRGKLVKA